ncbi:hypothetical protein KI387_008314, partial [Taxus chinensis]
LQESMSIVAGFLIFFVNFVSFAVTRILSVIMKTFVGIPGQAVTTILSHLTTVIRSILVYLTEIVIEILVLGVSVIGSLVKSTADAFISCLTTICLEFMSELRGGLHGVEEVVKTFIEEYVVEPVGVSMVNVWNNIVDAVHYFVENIYEA